MYGESLLSPRHPVVVPRQLVGRVDPLEGEVLSLVLGQAAHTCQPCSHHDLMRSQAQQLTHPTGPGCWRRKLSSGGIWRPGLGLRTIGGIGSCLSSLLGLAGTWSQLWRGLWPALQRTEHIWSWWLLARQLLGGSSCSRTLRYFSPGRWCSPTRRASRGWRRTSSGWGQSHRRTDCWNICCSHSSAARKIFVFMDLRIKVEQDRSLPHLYLFSLHILK